MTVADFFIKNGISNFPPLSEEVDIFSHCAVKGYFLYALEDYFTDYDSSPDGINLNFLKEEFYLSDFIGVLDSLEFCLGKYTPDQAEAKFHLFKSLFLE